MGKQKLYKILDKDGRSCNGGDTKWFLPKKQKDGTWKSGKWMPIIQGELITCKNGYHLCREKDLLNWLNESIYEAEYKGIILESDNKVVVRQARLLRKCENWDARTARLFACWCVRNTPLENGGTVWDLLTDERSKNAVAIAEQFANGKVIEEELRAAQAAARGATRAAAWGAAQGAAWGAAWGAAQGAAQGAAWGAAQGAAQGATRAAAQAAARGATWAAAQGAAWGAAWGAAQGAAQEAAWGAAWGAAQGAAQEAAWGAARAAQIRELLRILNEVRK